MVNSLPFLVVLDMCTTLARLDLGIVEGFYCCVVSRGICRSSIHTLVFLIMNFLIFVVGAKISREFLGKDDVNACLHQLLTGLSCTILINGLMGADEDLFSC